MEQVVFQDLGRISYQKAWDYQHQLQDELISQKRLNWERERQGEAKVPPPHHYLLFCEHNPVYTLGKSGSVNHLLLSEMGLKEKGVEFFKIDRGGDITYHGPGQITGYPIFDLDEFFTDIHKYVRYLEETVIRTLSDYGIGDAFRIDGYTGVWLPEKQGLPKRKICAIGVHLSRWVTMHGFAFNVNTDLDYFQNIVPCGIAERGKSVTSLAAELGRKINMEEVKTILKRHFAELFGFEFAEHTL